MNIDITPLIQAIVGICAALITYRLIPYIKSKTTAQQWTVIRTVANTAATAAQSLDKTGAEKKTAAMETVTTALEKNGIKLDPEIVDKTVEAAYQQVKQSANTEVKS